jgi:hypothetical protein
MNTVSTTLSSYFKAREDYNLRSSSSLPYMVNPGDIIMFCNANYSNISLSSSLNKFSGKLLLPIFAIFFQSCR